MEAKSKRDLAGITKALQSNANLWENIQEQQQQTRQRVDQIDERMQAMTQQMGELITLLSSAMGQQTPKIVQVTTAPKVSDMTGLKDTTTPHSENQDTPSWTPPHSTPTQEPPSSTPTPRDLFSDSATFSPEQIPMSNKRKVEQEWKKTPTFGRQPGRDRSPPAKMKRQTGTTPQKHTGSSFQDAPNDFFDGEEEVIFEASEQKETQPRSYCDESFS